MEGGSVIVQEATNYQLAPLDGYEWKFPASLCYDATVLRKKKLPF